MGCEQPAVVLPVRASFPFRPGRLNSRVMSTLFGKIVRKEIPAQIVYEDDQCMAFHDLHPQAPVHVLIIPKQEIAKLGDAKQEDAAVLGHLMTKVPEIARSLNLRDFRVVVNSGAAAGQTVFHLHLHLLGGRPFSWPPG